MTKNSPSPSIVSQRIPIPTPRARPTQDQSISATPPPEAVELRFHSCRPSSSSRALPRPASKRRQASGSIRPRRRSSESGGTCISRAVIFPGRRAPNRLATPEPCPEGSSSTALAAGAETIRRGPTPWRTETTPPASSRKTRSRAKRMPKVWTLRQRGISSPAPARRRSRWARPSSRAGSRRRDRHAPAEHCRRGEAAQAAGGHDVPSDERSRSPPRGGKVAVFGPNPMLSVTVEALTSEGGDDIHVHAAGQGVWVARMAAEMGAERGALRLPRRRDRRCPAAAAGAAAVRPAADRDRRGERLLHPRPPQRRAGAGRPERRPAALAPRDRRPLLRHPGGSARRRRARPLRPLSQRGAAAGDLRRPGRRRARQTAPRSSSTSRRRGSTAPWRAAPTWSRSTTGSWPVHRGPGRHRRADAGRDRAAARGRRRRGDRHPRRGAGDGRCAARRPGS